MRVEVYWNARRRDFSVRALEGPDKGRVIAHETYVALRDATFHVSKAGQARVRREGRKNVHAVIRGTVAGHRPPGGSLHLGEVRYNPFRDDGFMLQCGFGPCSEGQHMLERAAYVRCKVVDRITGGPGEIRVVDENYPLVKAWGWR